MYPKVIKLHNCQKGKTIKCMPHRLARYRSIARANVNSSDFNNVIPESIDNFLNFLSKKPARRLVFKLHQNQRLTTNFFVFRALSIA